VIEADEFERGCKQRRDWRTDLGETALPDLALITARLHLRFASSARRCRPCLWNRRAYCFCPLPLGAASGGEGIILISEQAW